MAYKDYSEDVITTKKGYSVSTDGSENQTASLENFMPEKKKKITVDLKNSGSNNTYHSSYFEEVITTQSGSYSMYLYGNGNKTVKLGNTSGNNIRILNSGKNTITAGDGGNTFELSNYGAKNTVTSGTGDDTYYMTYGTNKITDKGGSNEYHVDSISTNTITSGTGLDKYYIARGTNNIVDKGGDNEFYYNGVEYYGTVKTGAGADTFDIVAKSTDGTLKINTGNGIDTLKIHNSQTSFYYPTIIADLGNDKDYVFVDYVDSSSTDISFTNIKTGKGEDEVTISAGKENIIDTGADKDIITIDGGLHNYISSGDGNDEITVKAPNTEISTPNSVIRAGKGSDTIKLGYGTNTVYGDAGVDTITVTGGTNTIYGGAGKDKITAFGTGVNKIYADGDEINLYNGNNTVIDTKGKNDIKIYDGSATLDLKKGGNEVISITSYETTVTSSGNNKFDFEGTGSLNITATKGKQDITIAGTSDIYGQLGSGDDVLTYSSTHQSNQTLKTGAGKDTINLYGGKKIIYAEAGNDTFNIYGGANHVLYGGTGVDTFNIENVNTSNITGEDGNDIFNIKGGYKTSITGSLGNDIYNLYKSGVADTTSNSNYIFDLYGRNTYNIKSGYTGTTVIDDSTNSSNVVFDKNLKLSNSDSTDSNTVSIYGKFDTNGNYTDVRLVFDMNSEISNKTVQDNVIYIDNAENMKYSVGKKNYNLDLSELSSTVASWLSTKGYADTDAVFTNEKTTGDIGELVAIFEENTASCFIK